MREKYAVHGMKNGNVVVEAMPRVRNEKAEKKNAEALETARKAQLEAEEKNMRLSIQQEADNRLKQTLRFKAMHDDLTGIYNMNGFKEAVRLALQNNPDLMKEILKDGVKIYG